MSPRALSVDDTKLKAVIEEYTSGEKPKIPGLVYCAVTDNGEPFFQHASGKKGASTDAPMTLDTVFWLLSFTKLLTSIAAMQCVESGLLNLDDADQLESLTPELRDTKVLQRGPDGRLNFVEKRGRITLRMLLSHTAGFGYAFEDDRLAEVSRPIGLDDFSCDNLDAINRPLVNQPGEKFQYGTSMDCVGIIIERVSGLSLEAYFLQHITGPLGISSITFRPTDQAQLQLAHMHHRDHVGDLIEIDHLYRKPLLAKTDREKESIFCAGGHGCFGKPTDFVRIIGVLLNNGTDARTNIQLLKPTTVEEMFTDQIPDKPRYSNEFVPVAKPFLARPTPLAPMPDDHTEGWGLSFAISHYPSPTGRPAGSGSWEGLANLFWFADRSNKLGGIIATQIAPYGDPFVLECSDRIETELYRAILTRDDITTQG